MKKIIKYIKEYLAIFTGIIFGLTFWVLDIFIDVFMFKEGTIAENLSSPEPMEIYFRVIVGALFVAFGFHNHFVVRKRKAIETEVNKNQIRYQNLFSSMLNGFALHKIIVDENGRPVDYQFLEANEAFEKMTGLSRKDIMGRRATEIMPELVNDGFDWIGTYGKVALDNQKMQFEQYSQPLGKWYNITAYSPSKGEFATVFEDITERKKIEGVVRENQERMDTIFNSIQAGIMVIDRETHTISYVNDAAVKMIGTTREKLLDQPCQKHVCPADYGACPITDKRQKVDNSERVLLIADGRKLPIIKTVVEVELDGRPVLVESFVDISAHKALETENQLKAKLLDAVTDSILVHDYEGTPVYYNEAACRERGLSRDEMAKINIFDMSTPETLKQKDERLQKIDQFGEYTFETEGIRKDGGLFQTEVHAIAVNIDGKKNILSVSRDSTERKRAERELSESKALVEAVVENIPNMVFLKEAKDLRFLIFNRAGEELLGYDRKDLMGKNNLDLFPPEQAAHFMAKDREVLDGAEGILDIPEEPIQTAKKGQRLLHTRKVCIRGADGTAKYLLGISEDITERKRYEDELRASEEKYRLITENTADTITVMDLNFKITYVSPSIQKLRGYSVEEAKMQSVDQIILPAYLPKVYKMFEEQMALEESGADPSRTVSMELEESRKDGTVIWAEVTMSFLRDKDHKAAGIVTMTKDITERKRAEKLQDALYHISEAVVKSEDLETLYGEIHKTVSELISAKNFYIALYHEKEESLSFPYFVDEVDPVPQSRKLANGLTEYVLKTGTPLLASPVVLNLLIAQGKVSMVGTPAIDWAGVPLKVGNRTLGVLVVQSYREDVRFGAEALSMLNFVSDNIALAIARKNDEEERKKLTADLRKLSVAVEQSPSVIVVTDLEGNIEYANPAFEKITGYTMNEVQGKNPRVLKSGELPGEEYKKLWETISNGGEWRGQFHNKRKDGSLYWEQAAISGIRDTEGKVVKYLAVKEDITERKMMEDELKASEAQNRVLVESAGRTGEAILMMQNDGDIQVACLVANQEAVRITGYSQEELKKISWLDLVHPRFREESQKRAQARLHNEDIPGIYEISLVSKYGVEIPIEVTGSPVQYQGRPAIVGFFREISQRKKAEAERETMISELKEALGSIKQLKGLIPICASCKKIRNDGGYWQQVEEYVSDHSDADFSHGLCDDCAHKLYPDYFPDKKNEEIIPPQSDALSLPKWHKDTKDP